jgi:hypothetical protein
VVRQGAQSALLEGVVLEALKEKTGGARAARVRMMTRASGVTMIRLGAFLALVRREA